ncbi:MAG: LacI family DNA-binding transcriptional regulator [Butyricicoccus sp.]|nr:LacI family DNA-binding transcriptional regulator [Butyricicoccus sp.]
MKMTTSKIAELAGTSRGAVDKTIHGRPGVRPEVRARILQVIEETGYIPLKDRRCTAPDRPQMVAAIIPRLTNPYFVALKARLEEVCRTLPGLQLEVYPCDTTDVPGLLTLLDRLAERSIDGLLLRGVKSRRLCDKLNALALPVIFLDSDVPGAERLCLVGEDCYKSGRLTASLLAKSIGFSGQTAVFTGMPEITSHTERLKGFLDVMRTQYPGIEVVEQIYTRDQSAVAYERASHILAEHPALRGICNLAGCSGEIGRAIFEQRRSRAIPLVCFNTAGDVADLIRKDIVTFSLSIRPREQARLLLGTMHAYLTAGTRPSADCLYVPIAIALDENIESLTEDFGPF